MAEPSPTARQTGARQLARTLSQLQQAELRGTEDVAWYAASVNAIAQTMALEVSITAHELAQVLARESAGRGGIDRFAAGRQARRATRRLRASAEDFRDAGHQALRFFGDYMRVYDQLVHPQRDRRRWQWEEGGQRQGGGR